MSGYQDPKKMADARALHQSFTKAAQASRGKPQTQKSLPPKKSHGLPSKPKVQVKPFKHTPNIGSANLDFLNRRDQVAAAEACQPKASVQAQAPPAASVTEAPAATNSIVDEFWAAVSSARQPGEESAEAEESLIDFSHEEVIPTPPMESSTTATDLLGIEVKSQSRNFRDPLSAVPATKPADKPNPNTQKVGEVQEGKNLSPHASAFVSAGQATAGVEGHALGFNPQGPWTIQMPAAALPSVPYMILVPMPFAAAPAKSVQAPSTNGEARWVRKPKEGLKASKWAN